MASKVKIVGSSIQAFGKSLHAGQTGVIVADYGTMVMVKADDEAYSGASKSTGLDGKYFQVDSLLYKIIKEGK
jgi:hypothetical protein